MRVDYQGGLHTVVIGDSSQQVVHTDGLRRYGGKGECFSPGDLLGASLGSCMATMIGIYASTHGWDLTSMHLEMTKEKKEEGHFPISSFTVKIVIPRSLSDEEKEAIKKESLQSPMAQCLHPSIAIHVEVTDGST